MRLRGVAFGQCVLLVFLAAQSGCGGGESEFAIRESRSGDTTFVTIAAGLDTVALQVDSVEVLWRDERLGRPNTMASVDGHLVVGDRDRIHLLTADGGYMGTFGQAGQGPTEFGRVAAVGGLDAQIVALDSRNIRYATIDLSGTFGATHTVVWPVPYVNPRQPADALRFWGGGALRVADENVHLERPTRSALIWESLLGDSSKVLQEWDDVRWIDAGSLLAPDSVYPGRAIVALAPDGRVAFGDGIEYCVSIQHLGQPEVLRVCRDRDRARVGPGVRRASVDGVDVPPRIRTGITDAIRAQQVGEFIPSYDRLVFAEEGRLWIRALGRDAADVHPSLAYWVPEALPSFRRWEAIGPDGHPSGAVLLPAPFDPRIFEGNRAIGFFETENGEVVVARATW